MTSPDGVYQFARLPPGKYVVLVELSAFAPFRASSVEITRHLRTPLDITLVLATTETVNILADAGEATIAAAASNRPVSFGTRELSALPLPSGRTVQSLQPYVPGILFTESKGNLAQFTSIGQPRFANRLSIDGVPTDLAVDVRAAGIGEGASGGLPATATSGGLQTVVPWDAIQEIQVFTTSTTPEHARTPGAQTVVVTRSGSDQHAGTFHASVRPNTLAASDWFSNAGLSPRRETTFSETGMSAGGPIWRGRLNYFGTWERQAGNRLMTTTIPVPSFAARNAAGPAIRPLLMAFPEPNGAELEDYLAEYSGTFPVRSNLWTLSSRTDVHLGPRLRAFFRVNRGKSVGDALTAAPYQYPVLSYTNRESTSTTTLTAGWTWIVGDATTSEFRISQSLNAGEANTSAAEHGNALELSAATVFPALPPDSWVAASLFPAASGTVASGRFSDASQRQFSVSGRSSLVRGRHQWSIGFEYRRNVTEIDASRPRFVFRSTGIPELLQGRPVIVSATSQLQASGFLRQSWAGFAQDTFRLSTRLTLDYGVRYGVEPPPSNPSGVAPLLLELDSLPQIRVASNDALWKTSWTRFSPRVGAAYRLAGSNDEATAVVRANWGLTFDELTSPGGAAFGRGYPYFTGRIGAAPEFPRIPAALIAPETPKPFRQDGLSDYFAFPRNLRVPRTSTWQVALDREIGARQRLSLSFVQTRGRNLIYWYGYGAGATRAAINAYSNDGQSNYRGLFLDYTKRLSNRWHARVSYAWSRSTDLDSGERLSANAPPSLVEPSLNLGPSDFDRPHVLRLTAGWQLQRAQRLPLWYNATLGGWSMDVVGTILSGAPLSVTEPRPLGGVWYDLRLDRVTGESAWIVDRSAPGGRRLNPAAFSQSSAERQGTLARNSIRSPLLKQVDLLLVRPFLLGRGTTGTIRVSVFNLFNAANFGAPESTLALPGFGRAYQSEADAMGAGTLARGGLSPVYQPGGPRTIEVGFRLRF